VSNAIRELSRTTRQSICRRRRVRMRRSTRLRFERRYLAIFSRLRVSLFFVFVFYNIKKYNNEIIIRIINTIQFNEVRAKFAAALGTNATATSAPASSATPIVSSHSDELHRHDQRDHGKRRERRSARSPMPERQGRLRHRLERHRRRRHRRRVPAANDDSRAPVRLAAHVAVSRRAAALDGTLHSTSSRRVLKRFAAAGSSPVPQQSAFSRLSLVLYWLCECDTTISVKARHQTAMLSRAAVHRLESLLKQNGATATTAKASVRAVLAMLLAPAPASIADLCNRTKVFGNALLTNRSPLAHTVESLTL
jgi:hypothetical protein